MMKRPLRTMFLFLFVLILTGIAIGSLLPANQVSQVFVVKDWILHFMAYLVCSGCAMLGFSTRRRRLLALLSVTLVGFAIELIQPNFGRLFAWHDVLANMCGVLAALPLERFHKPISTTIADTARRHSPAC